MGTMTDDMTRLVGEINIMRNTREALMNDLAQGTKEMKTFVATMLGNFSKAHHGMAKRAKADRIAFVTGLEKRVLKLRREMATDLAGARRAWHGKGAKK